MPPTGSLVETHSRVLIRAHEKIPLHSLHESWMHIKSDVFFIICPLCNLCLCRQRLLNLYCFALRFLSWCLRFILFLLNPLFCCLIYCFSTRFELCSFDNERLAAISASDKWRHSAALFNIPLVNCLFNHSRLKHPLKAKKGEVEGGREEGGDCDLSVSVWQASMPSDSEKIYRSYML